MYSSPSIICVYDVCVCYALTETYASFLRILGYLAKKNRIQVIRSTIKFLSF